MSGYCACCGRPADHHEEHHVNQQRGDNHPDNLSPRDRRCHMAHHDNCEAVEGLTQQRYGPRRPRSSPMRPNL